MLFPRKYGVIPLQEIQRNPDLVTKRIRSGEVLLVTKRSKPIFKLIPPFEEPNRPRIFRS